MDRADPASIFTAASTLACIHINHLDGCDFPQLGHCHAAHCSALARRGAARGDPSGLLDEVGVRGGFGDEAERPVTEGGDHHGHRHAGLHALRASVEFLAELHDVQAALAQRRTNRRRRIGFAGRYLQLDVANDLLCHAYPGSSSKGPDRGANDTRRSSAEAG